MLPRPDPIYSVHEEDPDLGESINDFVIGLAERVDALQDLHSLADFTRLALQCVDLGDEARRLGYPLLESVAHAAGDACKAGKQDESEQALMEMSQLTQRIRQGHRGAA
jgi:hypothetical protein